MTKTPSQTYTEQVNLVRASDLNGSKRLFGGNLLSWIDITAAIVARRHAECNVTTVAIDDLHFIAPAHANDTVVLCGKMTYAGRTSMEVTVESYVERLDGTRTLINRAHAHNLAVHYWTINDPAEMRMLIENGADGIMTDYPHRLAEVYATYNK